MGRTKSIAAIEAAMHANSSVFLVAQREMDEEEPALRDLYAYGVIAEIKQVLRVSDDLVKVLVEARPVPVCWSWTPAKSICRPRYAPWLCAVFLPTSATRSRLSFAA